MRLEFDERTLIGAHLKSGDRNTKESNAYTYIDSHSLPLFDTLEIWFVIFRIMLETVFNY